MCQKAAVTSVACASAGDPGIRLRVEGAAETEAEALQPPNSSCRLPHPGTGHRDTEREREERGKEKATLAPVQKHNLTASFASGLPARARCEKAFLFTVEYEGRRGKEPVACMCPFCSHRQLVKALIYDAACVVSHPRDRKSQPEHVLRH